MMKFVFCSILLALCIFLGVKFCSQEKSKLHSSLQVSEAFSFKEIEAIEPFDMIEPSFLQASDGAQLAYYKFANPTDKNIVVLYAGAGLYGNKTYQWVAKKLHEQYDIGCYIFDIRGHGHSQGEPGDAPSIAIVLNDVNSAVQFVKGQHSHAKIYLTGHCSGAGLLINYAAHQETKLEDGYIFIAPYLGPKSNILQQHANPDENFVKSVRSWIYSLGLLFPSSPMIHWNAIFFNYPNRISQADSLIVSAYSYVMSCATTPYDAAELLKKIDKPTAIFVGDHDEQFISEKVISYKDFIDAPVQAQIIKGSGHLSILLQAPELISSFIIS